MNMNEHGVYETNGIDGFLEQYGYSSMAELCAIAKETVDWTAKGLRVIRLRLLTDPGYPMWDVSYCLGVVNGQIVNVQLPFSQLKKGRVKHQIIDHAKRAGVYAFGLGILEDAVISKLN